MSLRVLVAADDPLARAGLAALVAQHDDINVIGQVNTTETFDLFRPDIVVLDLGWETNLSLNAGEDISSSLVPLVVLMADFDLASETISNLRRGSAPFGVIGRTPSLDGLVSTMQAVIAGYTVLDPEILDTYTPISADIPEITAEALTPRESEVLNLIAEGLPNKTIAHQLAISEHTVKFHVNAILSKLGAGSRTEAVVRATRLGWITL